MTRRVLFAAVAMTSLLVVPPASARWADWPPGPSDTQLEQVVRVAYAAAASLARNNLNYFARDGVTEPLRSAIEDELGRQGLTFVNVDAKPATDLEAARLCAGANAELRFAVNVFGDGIDLAVATDKRVFSYHYEPRENAAIVVAPSGDCAKN